MSKTLSLVVLKDKRVVEFATLAEKPDCIKPIMPKRKPQQVTLRSKIWIINASKREALVEYVDDIYEQLEAMWMREKDGYRTRESLSGWFGLMGLVSRWIRDTAVVWGLYLSDNDIQSGEPLKA